MQFTVNHVSLEGLNIPKSDEVIKIGMSKPEYMADDKAIKEAETELGFKLGPQTKEFFKKWAGLYFSGGTEYVSDIKLAVGQTGMIFEEDDRLKNKKIDRIVVGADGFGNHLCADTNDKLSWYYHDSNPVFDTSETKSMKLFAYIEKQFAESKERKSKKAAKESLEAGLEMLDPTKIRDYQLESMVSVKKFKVFNKECATRVSLHLNEDGTLDKAAFETFNQVAPKIGSILEKGIAIITAGVNDMAWVKEEGKVLSESDIKRLFKGVGEIDIGSHRDTDGNYIYPVALVRLLGTAPWDEEHGLDVLIHKGRVICASLGGDLY